MHYFSLAFAIAALAASLAVVDAAKCSASGHRRHHSKGTNLPSRISSAVRSSETVAPAKQSSNSSSLRSSDMSGVTKNGVFIGLLPDEGDAGGSRENMAQLNSAWGGNAATYGWYAQAHSGTPFDGSQLLQVMDDLKASGAIFEPAVMPVGGWQGLTGSDNSQAVAICNVMKKFTDEGIEVRLRFAHEVNWYQTDGTYQGTASDFKAGWAAVAAACKSNDQVKMFFTPNIANMQAYQQYFPDDPSTVDYCGIDFYPQSADASFTDAMQGFYDFCQQKNPNSRFAIGETGLGFGGSIDQRLKWLDTITKAKDSMPKLDSVTWFNFQKGYDFKIVNPNGSNEAMKTFIA